MDLTCISNDEISERVGVVLRQTDYSEEQAKRELAKHNYDVVMCIQQYLGVLHKKNDNKKAVSVNQRIYQELRRQMGNVQLPDPVQARQDFNDHQ
jgi:hypothetical protein